MARTGANYTALNGAKLEHSASSTGTFAQIYGLKSIPEIGGTPNTIDTTDLDNTEFETNIMGLKPAQVFEFEFNLELPTATSNIKVVHDLKVAGTKEYWKITYASGVTVAFQSEVEYSLTGGATGDLETFKMYLSPVGEPTITVPTVSA